MDSIYLYFKFNRFGDAYCARENVFTIGEANDGISYYEVCDILNNAGFVGVAKSKNEPFEDISHLDLKEEYLKFGWLEGKDIEVNELASDDPEADDWVLSFPPAVKFENDKKEN